MKEEIDNKTIELYIQKLVISYGLYPTVSDTALLIQFTYGLYAECIYEIMRKMGLSNKLKVICYADYKYPCSESVARILLPQTMPLLGSKGFNSLKIDVEIRESAKKHFYSFISSIAHELSHLVMYGTKHELCKSEIATDLCMLVFGFQNFVIKGKRMAVWTLLGNKNVTLGYLSTEQLQYAIGYIEQLKSIKVIELKRQKKNYFIEYLCKIFRHR